MFIENISRKIYLKLYFFFKKKFLFKDGYNLSYYIYKNTRPEDTFKRGVRTDDTTVFYVIDKILSSNKLINTNIINCLDVGGYIGVITLLMSKKLNDQKKNWKIHTFEPFYESFLKLKENVNLDPNKDNIILNNVAVSNKVGYSLLKSYINTPGENHLDSAIVDENFAISDDYVKVITLENYVHENNINHINICKIDTEGSDYLVTQGLSEYINKKKIDFLIFEYQDDNFLKIYNFLEINSYKVFYLVRNEDILVRSLKNYPKISKKVLNFIAVSPDKVNDFVKKFNLEQ